MSFYPIAFFDPPLVIDCSVTPIPGSGSNPLQVIADTGIQIGVGIFYTDTTGDFIGVYIGKVGVEKIVCVIGNGLSSLGWGQFPMHSRVSIRSMKAAQVTGGLLQGVVVTS